MSGKSTMIKETIKNALLGYKFVKENINNYRKEGYSDNDIFKETTSKYKEYIKRDHVKKFISDGIKYLYNIDSKEIIEKYKEVTALLEKYFENEDEEILKQLIEEVHKLNIIKDNALKEKIGDKYYNELISIVALNCFKVTKITYQYAKNKISKTDYIGKIKSQVESYTMQVVKFLKDKVEIQDYAKEIIQFAFGNKVKAFLGVTLKIAAKIFNRQREKKQQFEEMELDPEKIYKTNNQEDINEKVIKERSLKTDESN
ncbi:hypothetical protein [Mammaliicoccus sciuri]|uniref:hypothetical protein n=1 Tax=Mammaliicoccus sciuri TaxID=1296 RepID=UPI003F561077